MKEVWQKATEQVCRRKKGPPRHSETWWWNDEIAKTIEEKRRCYKIWHKTKTASDRNKYKEARRNARSVALAEENIRQELVNELESTAGKKNVYRVAKQMAKSRHDVVLINIACEHEWFDVCRETVQHVSELGEEAGGYSR